MGFFSSSPKTVEVKVDQGGNSNKDKIFADALAKIANSVEKNTFSYDKGIELMQEMYAKVKDNMLDSFGYADNEFKLTGFHISGGDFMTDNDKNVEVHCQFKLNKRTVRISKPINAYELNHTWKNGFTENNGFAVKKFIEAVKKEILEALVEELFQQEGVVKVFKSQMKKTKERNG